MTASTAEQYTRNLQQRLQEVYPQTEARQIAREVMCHVLGCDLSHLLASASRVITSSEEDALDAMLQRLMDHCPMQYVLGYTYFAGMKIRVGEGCLIPRPETEELYVLAADDLEQMLDNSKDRILNVLDICTGSGCLAYAFAKEFPEVQVYGCDISAEALSFACRQRVKLQGARPVFFQADVLAPPPAGLPEFDIIIANPPYILESEAVQMRRNVLDYEPHIALFTPDEDPLRFYKGIASWADALLRPGGRIYLEINEHLGSQTAALFPGSQVLQDINGKERFVVKR